MKKIYALLSGMLLLPAVSFAAGEAKNYPGFLNVEMGGEKIADNQPSSITITPTGRTGQMRLRIWAIPVTPPKAIWLGWKNQLKDRA